MKNLKKYILTFLIIVPIGFIVFDSIYLGILLFVIAILLYHILFVIISFVYIIF